MHNAFLYRQNPTLKQPSVFHHKIWEYFKQQAKILLKNSLKKPLLGKEVFNEIHMIVYSCVIAVAYVTNGDKEMIDFTTTNTSKACS